MSYLVWLVPIALMMGGVGLAAFFWSVQTGQYEDLEGAAERVLLLDSAAAPLGSGSAAEAAETLSGHSDMEGKSDDQETIR